ncbi:MAG: hypothetical protein M1546_06095 [Chloroflexi bacterium]|nr:hypothetical protein [Chloroflexota bacterium]
MTEEDTLAILWQIQSAKANDESTLSVRQLRMLGAADKILALALSSNPEGRTRELADRAGAEWHNERLPSPVSLAPTVDLESVVIVSGNLDFSLDNLLRIALLLRIPVDRQNRWQGRSMASDWAILEQGDRIIARGTVKNLIENSGFERPALDGHVPGVLPPVMWGGGPDSWRNIYLQDWGESRGQVACVTGKTRLSFPFKSVTAGSNLFFGADYHSVTGDMLPYLIALSPKDDSVVLVSQFALMHPSRVSGWRTGYGIAKATTDSKVSLFLEGGSLDNPICLDNVFLTVLPDWLTGE